MPPRRVTGDYFLIAAIKRERDRHASVLALPAFDVRVPRKQPRNVFLKRNEPSEKRYSMGDGTWGRKKRDDARYIVGSRIFFYSNLS